MGRPPPATSHSALGEEVLAIEVEIVREILDSIPITRLPIAPPYLSGVIDVRGATVPVIDLRVKLGMPPAPATQDTRILIVDLGPTRGAISSSACMSNGYSRSQNSRPKPANGTRHRRAVGSEYIKGYRAAARAFRDHCRPAEAVQRVKNLGHKPKLLHSLIALDATYDDALGGRLVVAHFFDMNKPGKKILDSRFYADGKLLISDLLFLCR